MKLAFKDLLQSQMEENFLIQPSFGETINEYSCVSKDCQFKAVIQNTKFMIETPHTCRSVLQMFASDDPHCSFNDGQQIILSFSFDEMYGITLQAGSAFQCRYGMFMHDQIIGNQPGAKLPSKDGRSFVIALQFHPTLHTESLKRRTQILFTPDIATIIGRSGIRPGSVVVEAGIGSGSLSHALLQAIYPSGFLFNYDIDVERVKTASSEFELFLEPQEEELLIYQQRNFESIPLPAETVVCNTLMSQSAHLNVCEAGFSNVPANVVNLLFLDLPEPHLCVTDAARILISGAALITFLPCAEQVHKFISAATKSFGGFEVFKNQSFGYELDNRPAPTAPLMPAFKIQKDMYRSKQLRRVVLGRTHTGYLVYCWKIGQ